MYHYCFYSDDTFTCTFTLTTFTANSIGVALIAIICRYVRAAQTIRSILFLDMYIFVAIIIIINIIIITIIIFIFIMKYKIDFFKHSRKWQDPLTRTEPNSLCLKWISKLQVTAPQDPDTLQKSKWFLHIDVQIFSNVNSQPWYWRWNIFPSHEFQNSKWQHPDAQQQYRN